MKKILILTISFLLIVTGGFCQRKDDVPLDLREAIRLSFRNLDKLKAEQYNIEWAKNQVSVQKAARLPQLSADLDWRFNPKLQTTLLPNEQGVDEPIAIDTKYNTIIGGSLSYDVFNPSARGNLSVKEAAVKSAQLAQGKVQEQVIYDVMKAYFNVLFRMEKRKLSASNRKVSQAQMLVATTRWNNQKTTENERIKADVTLSNAVFTFRQDSLNYVSALKTLKYFVGLSTEKAVALTESIESIFGYAVNLSPGLAVPSDIKIEQQLDEINNLEIKKQRMMLLPTLTVYGNYTFQYLSDDYQPFDEASWYPFSYLGIKASVSLFDGGQRRRTITGFILKKAVSQAQINQLRSDYDEAAQKATTQMELAREDITYQKKNLAYLEKVMITEMAGLENGTLILSDVESTEYLVKEAQNNYLDSVYNFLIALLEYHNASGNLTNFSHENK